MLSIPSTVSIFLYTEPTDMRKSCDGLSGIVRSGFAANPNGSLFLFINSLAHRSHTLKPDPQAPRSPAPAAEFVARHAVSD